MEVFQVTNENIEDLRKIYTEFTKNAQRDFLFEIPPIKFDDLKANFSGDFVKAYIAKDNEAKGFLLYSDNLTQGIELTLIYSENNNLEIKKAILKKFVDDCKIKYNNRVISYPMLGVQNDIAKAITDFGFSTVGELILEQKLENLKKNQITLPPNYQITSWQDNFADIAAEIIFEEFKGTNDAKFDTRFKTLDGTKNIVECITKGYYGDFLNNETSVITFNNQPVGICFINLTTKESANVPLLVVTKEHQGKNFGEIMLKNSLNKIIQNTSLVAKTISTTCDADNIPAQKSYEKTGFQTKSSYYHAYIWV